MLGKETIKQVIPVVRPTYVIYTIPPSEGGYIIEQIYYLGLFDDGGIRGLECIEGYFQSAENVSNFLCLCGEEELNQYKTDMIYE